MDPNATVNATVSEIRNILEAMRDEWERVDELCCALHAWQQKGGFAPSSPLTEAEVVILHQLEDVDWYRDEPEYAKED
jgi:hypothetical protein